MMWLAAGAATVSIALAATIAAGRRYEPPTNDATADAPGSTGPDDVDALEGTYPANECGRKAVSLYLPGADVAEVTHDAGAYFWVQLRTECGEVVGTGHRPAHRIRGALDDGPGYDYVARDPEA